jgi:hypothetical protein
MDKDELIKDLLQVIRIYRVTSTDSLRLVAKRQVWRQNNNYPEDDLIQELAAMNEEALTFEKVFYNRHRLEDKDGELHRAWFLPPKQPFED